jgi:putative DNA-invertase from lambdoid prophage Rac
VIQKVAIYARVSTDEQDALRQVSELREFATRSNYCVEEVFIETASGAKNDRKERAKVMLLARQRKIQAVLVSEMSRWGRSTQDLLSTLEELASWNCSVLTLTGMDFDMSTATGRLMVTILAGVSEFERGLLRERITSGIKHAKAKGVKFGRPAGKDKSRDKNVMQLVAAGKSYREIRDLIHISPTTVMEIVKRNK